MVMRLLGAGLPAAPSAEAGMMTGTLRTVPTAAERRRNARRLNAALVDISLSPKSGGS
jgi:hypothetical protein